jgi:transposase InsO family protein
MLNEKIRMAVALKRFALISPILNGQVSSVTEYCSRICEEPIEMPHYGAKKYAPNTVKNWYSDYVREGIDALKPKARSDIGQTRVITPEMEDLILAKMEEYPKAPATVLYDMLIEERAFLGKDASLPTIRRFIARNRRDVLSPEAQKEMFRFAMEHANDLWQADLMYGVYITDDSGKKRMTYLLAYIDDATRLATHAEFYFRQDIRSLRDSFREAVLRRGVPKALFTDNGKIYRCQGFEYLCANIGVTLLRHAVRSACSKGKIERFFKTVRTRFLSRLTKNDMVSLETLNEKFWLWLENDYQCKPHEGIGGKTPKDAFLAQSETITLITDLAVFNEKFMVRVKRTVKKDATISLDGDLYETDMSLAGIRVDIRYDPDTEGPVREIFLFSGDAPIGIARLVSFTDNAKRKRNGSGADRCAPAEDKEGMPVPSAPAKEHTITYSEMVERQE